MPPPERFAASQAVAAETEPARVAELEQRLTEREEEWRDLVDRLLRSFDRDRADLAGRLHDGPLQMTTAVRLMADSLRHSLQDGDLAHARTALDSLERYAVAAAQDLRLTTQRLHPLVMRHGLVQALGSLAEAAAEEHQAAVAFEPPAGDWPDDADRDAALLEIAREATHNAVRHGRPPVVIALRVDAGEAVLTVTDRGPCPPTAAAGPGMWLIEARAGRVGASLRWQIEPGHCSLVLRMPRTAAR